MRKFNRILWLGLLALLFSNVVDAQVHGTNAGYPAGVVSGSATVWGNSMGDSGYSGTININNGYGYAAVPVPVLVAANPYAPVYYPAPVYVYPQPYYRGHGRGHGHRNKHGRGHGRGHDRGHH